MDPAKAKALFEQKPFELAFGYTGKPMSEHPAVLVQPGRLSSYQAEGKPAPADTPYRSKMVVSPRNSADGNWYMRGDPIPAAEARRQGIITEPPPPQRPAKRFCSRCQGSGLYSKRRPKGHPPWPEEHITKAGKPCPFCSMCPRCGGTRFEPMGEATS